MDSTVFDILVYVFDRYLLEELPTAERETLARDLESAGFGGASVERALDWLADLAEQRERPGLIGNERAFRIYSAQELARMDTACRGLLLALEQRLAHLRENLRTPELRDEFEQANRFRRE